MLVVRTLCLIGATGLLAGCVAFQPGTGGLSGARGDRATVCSPVAPSSTSAKGTGVDDACLARHGGETRDEGLREAAPSSQLSGDTGRRRWIWVSILPVVIITAVLIAG